MKNTQKDIIIKRALIAVAEARIQAKIDTGDASNALPTKKQSEDISAAESLNVSDAEAKQACEELMKSGFFAIKLYASEGGYKSEDIISEIKYALEM